jgi:hypothetical protein
MKRRDHLGDLTVDERRILKLTSKKLGARVWGGLDWFKKGPMARFCEHGNEHVVFVNGG